MNTGRLRIWRLTENRQGEILG